MTRRKRAAAGSFALAAALALAGVHALAATPAAHAAPPALGSAPAPRFSIRSLAGERLELDALRRRGPVLVDFWATWCKPCLASLPELEALHRAYGPRGLTVVGISIDGPRNRARIRPFVARLGLTYPIAVDEDGRVQQLYQAVAIPTAVLVDTSGAVAMVRIGYRHGEGEKLERAIRALLAGDAAGAGRSSGAAADSAAGDGR